MTAIIIMGIATIAYVILCLYAVIRRDKEIARLTLRLKLANLDLLNKERMLKNSVQRCPKCGVFKGDNHICKKR